MGYFYLESFKIMRGEKKEKTLEGAYPTKVTNAYISNSM